MSLSTVFDRIADGKLLIASMLAALMTSVIVVRLLWGNRLSELTLDRPKARSLHTVPTPRTGGVGIFIAVVVSLALFTGVVLPSLLVLALCVFVIFLVEDVVGVPLKVRLVVQVTASVAFLATVWPVPPLLLPVLVAAMVWSINLYNFMDGSHGMAGGMTVIGFGCLALASAAAGHQDIATLAALVASAALGFLLWNFQPARIFLGDCGAITIGFLAVSLAILGWHRGIWPFWFPGLVFAPFIGDATLTLAKRALAGDQVWVAHRDHYYQRLIRMGWSHRKVALAGYALMTGTGASALATLGARPIVVVYVLAVWSAILLAIVWAIDRRWTRSSVHA